MKQYYEGVISWASILDQNALDQAVKLARAEGVAGHIALMPDAHPGIGACVGSIVPTHEDTIIPSAVGVDIGCGMTAVETDLQARELGQPQLAELVHRFGRSIPAGVAGDHDGKRIPDAASQWLDENPAPDIDWTGRRKARSPEQRAVMQLGTLGSGNHFAEACKDETGCVWLVVHSGSRGIGNLIAQIYMDRARKAWLDAGKDSSMADSANLTGGDFREYIARMSWAQRYAKANRAIMMTAMMNDLERAARPFDARRRFDCHHNFAALEEHGGRTCWITRKGAIRADVGELGVIPGSMGADTYIVSGKGEPDSYRSSAHGAGRMHSRGQAKRMFSVESLRELMKGKAWNDRNAKRLLDEHPHAYKPIERVMEDQADLVSIEARLTQLVNYKGA